MRKILKNRALLMAVLGLLIMAQSILWEYVRVHPTYRFIVEPWSLRGYEVTQGAVIAAVTLGLAAFAVLIGRGVIKETLLSGAIAIGALLAWIAGVVAFSGAREVEMAFVVQFFLALVGAVAAVSFLQRYIPEEWSKRRRAARFGLGLASFLVLLFGVIGPLFSNTRPFWMYILVVGLVFGALSLLRPPRELASRRMLINGIVGIWVMSMTMSASLRQTLQMAQFDSDGINAPLLNLQITSGVLLAWFGGLVAFIGAVGMWAKRRDQIIAHERARKQQAAAADSAQQLAG